MTTHGLWIVIIPDVGICGQIRTIDTGVKMSQYVAMRIIMPFYKLAQRTNHTQRRHNTADPCYAIVYAIVRYALTGIPAWGCEFVGLVGVNGLRTIEQAYLARRRRHPPMLNAPIQRYRPDLTFPLRAWWAKRVSHIGSTVCAYVSSRHGL